MKKVERYIYIIAIVILLGVIAGGSVYFLNKDKDDKQPVNDKENSKGKENDNKYFKVDKYDYTINGKKHVIAFNYSKEFKAQSPDNVDGYYDYVTVSLDEKMIEDTKYVIWDINDNLITLDNIKIIKGTDKDYLVITFPDPSDFVDSAKPYILSDDGRVLDTIATDNTITIISMDNNGEEFYGKNAVVPSENLGSDSDVSYNNYKITDDAIYYVRLACEIEYEYVNDEYIYTLGEYKVTVNNDKVVEEKVGEYKATVGNAWC